MTWVKRSPLARPTESAIRGAVREPRDRTRRTSIATQSKVNASTRLENLCPGRSHRERDPRYGRGNREALLRYPVSRRSRRRFPDCCSPQPAVQHQNQRYWCLRSVTCWNRQQAIAAFRQTQVVPPELRRSRGFPGPRPKPRRAARHHRSRHRARHFQQSPSDSGQTQINKPTSRD